MREDVEKQLRLGALTEDKRETHEKFDDQLYFQAFQDDLLKEHSAIIDKMSEKELQEYYEKHRDEPLFKQVLAEASGSDEPSKLGRKRAVPFKKNWARMRETVGKSKSHDFFEKKLEELKKEFQVKIDKDCLARMVSKQ